MTEFFHNKTVWITGASSGIGEALAILLAGKGARIVLSARNKGALEQVADRCRNCGIRATTWLEAFDTSEHALFPEVVSRVLGIAGGIDILINNAGVGQRAAAISCAPEVVRRIMDVNFFGTVFLTQALLPSMIENGSGRIVVVSSVLGKFHLPGRSAYGASKRALQGYFDTLRTELNGTGVGVTIVFPGWIATRISQNALTSNGTAFCQTTGMASKKMSAEKCARHIADAVASGKNEATMGGIETWGVVARILFPRLYDWSVRSRTREFIHTR